MTFDPEKVFAGLVSLREELNATLPDDEMSVDFDIESDTIPGCFLLYNPNQNIKRNSFHFMACSEVIRNIKNECPMLYRITSRVSGRFDMCDGLLHKLPVCKHCLDEWTGDSEAIKNFNIREFFRKCGYKSQIPEEIITQIWMGAIEGFYSNTSKFYDCYQWKLISRICRETKQWHCDKCDKDFSNNHKQLHTHHKNMYKPDIRQRNLRVLCDSCHNKVHKNMKKEELK